MTGPRRHEKGRLIGGLWAAVLFSIAFHLFVLIPVVLLILSPSTSAREVSDEVSQPPETPLTQPPLGGEEGSPSSLVWIGYDTYQEHLAQLADVEQAAFTPSPAGNPSAQPSLVTPSTPGQDNTGQDQRTTLPINEPMASNDQPTTDQPKEIDETQQPQGLIQAPISTNGKKTIAMAPVLGPGPMILIPLSEMTAPTASTSPQTTTSQEPTKQETAAPGSGEAPTAKQTEPGTPADRASDATSTIDVPIKDWKLGRPLQAVGYEILTTKPQLTPLQQVSGTLGMREFPIVEVVFLSIGRPDDVRIIRSSGNRRADEILRQSVFKWRAQGKELESRDKDDPLVVRIKITFTRRRR